MGLPIHTQAAPRPHDLHPLVGDLTLRRGRVHKMCGPSRVMLASLVMAKGTGLVVWVRPGWVAERLNVAGLQRLADPARLILAAADREDALLWAAEKALRSGAPLIVAELLTPSGLTPIRRLHLAAVAGVTAAQRDGTRVPLGLILLPGAGGAPGGDPLADDAHPQPRASVGRRRKLDADAPARKAGPAPAARALQRHADGGETLTARPYDSPPVPQAG